MNFKLTPRQRRLAALKAQPNPSDEGSADKIYNITTGDFACYAEFFEKNQLEELVIEERGTRVLFRRHRAEAGAPAPLPAARAAESAAGRGGGQENAKTSEDAEPASANVTAILSPLNGAFYAAATPDSPPLVSVGSVVAPGTLLCLIEAMKIYNEIKAETSGRIVKVLVKNAESVKEGQELFWIE